MRRHSQYESHHFVSMLVVVVSVMMIGIGNVIGPVHPPTMVVGGVVDAFVVTTTTTINQNNIRRTRNGSSNIIPTMGPSLPSLSLSSSSDTTNQQSSQLLSVTLDKPMGMILEEVQEGQSMGVYVKELAEGGSALSSQYRDQLVGMTIASVMGKNVLTLDFDSIMTELINAPSPVQIQFVIPPTTSSGSTNNDEQDDSKGGTAGEEEEYSVGTMVTIKVLEDNDTKETIFQAKVGDNLRQVLFDNNVVVYRTFKAKIGNCNGGGQCTFCRADFIETQGWAPRSDYEDTKLKNSPDARLTCLNSIQGPATIRM
jgi:ferredoxin